MRLYNLPLLNAIVAAFTVGLCWGIIIPITSIILEEKAVSTPIIGFTASAIFIGMAVSAPGVGGFIDRYGIKTVLLSGILGSGVLMIALAFFTWLPLWIILRFFLGITFGAIIISSEVLINRTSSEENRGRNLGWYAFAFSFSLMSTPLALWIVRYGIAAPFVVGGIACGAAACLMTCTVPGMQHTFLESTFVPHLFSRISLPVATNFTAGFMEGALIALIPLYALREGFDAAQTGILLSAFMLGHGGSPPFIGMLGDRIGLRRVLALMYGLGIVVFITVVFSTFRMGLAFPFMLAGMSVGALYPLAVGLIGEQLVSRELPRGNAMITAAYGVGSILGPLVPSLIMHITVPQSLFVIATFLYVIVLIVMRLQTNQRAKD